MKTYSIIIILINMFSACVPAALTVNNVVSQYVYIYDTQSSTDALQLNLSLFMRLDDPNAIKELSAIYIIQNDALVFWPLKPGTWVVDERSGEMWIGSSRIAPLRQNGFAGNDYELVLLGYSGERIVIPLSLQAKPTYQFLIPQIARNEAIEEVEFSNIEQFQENNALVDILIYDSLSVLQYNTNAQKTMDYRQLFFDIAGKDLYQIYIYIYKPDLNISLYAGPY